MISQAATVETTRGRAATDAVQMILPRMTRKVADQKLKKTRVIGAIRGKNVLMIVAWNKHLQA